MSGEGDFLEELDQAARDRENLVARAKERAEASPLPEGWGYRIQLEEGDSFVGRWRSDAVDEQNDNRRVYLFWDEKGERCFSRHYAALGREIDRAAPKPGDTIVVYRGDNYTGQQGTGYSFGVETEPNEAPLPDDDEIPF
jgi:hypothetical protein